MNPYALYFIISILLLVVGCLTGVVLSDGVIYLLVMVAVIVCIYIFFPVVQNYIKKHFMD